MSAIITLTNKVIIPDVDPRRASSLDMAIEVFPPFVVQPSQDLPRGSRLRRLASQRTFGVTEFDAPISQRCVDVTGVHPYNRQRAEDAIRCEPISDPTS